MIEPKEDTSNKPLTKWKNEPTISDFKNDFGAMRSIHDEQAGRISGWLHNLYTTKRYSGHSNTDPYLDSGTTIVTHPSGGSSTLSKNLNDGRSKVQPKLIRKQAEWRYTSLSEPFLSTPDMFNMAPVTSEDVEAARQNELILNNQFNHKLDKVALIDDYVRVAVNEGTAILRVGWDIESVVTKTDYPIYEVQPTTDSKQIESLQIASQQPMKSLPPELQQAVQVSMSTQVPHYPIQVGVEIVEEDKIIKNQPSVRVCNYNNVYLDPTSNGDMDKAEFVIYSYETNVAELEKSGKYINLDDIMVESNGVMNDGWHDSNWSDSGFTFTDKARMKVVVYEYWGYWDIDGTGETKPIVASYVGGTIIQLEENPYPHGKIPFVVVAYLPVKDSLYGEPDGELLLDNQLIQGAITRGMIDSMARSANGQTGTKKGALDPVNKRKFERGQDYEFNDVGDAQQSIYQHSFPELPGSTYNMLNLQTQEAEALTGVKSFSEGITGAGLGSTAAAANGALSAAARRELGILRRLGNGMVQVAKLIMSMNAEFLEDEEIVRTTNNEFVAIRRDELVGMFDITLSISTAEADEQKAQELSFMLQTAGPAFGLEFTQIILSEIAVLRKMPALAKRIKEYAPQPDPMAQQQQQLDMAEQQAKIAKLNAETQKILAEAAGVGAKSQNAQADTDKKNLDYLEQAEGVTHARAMQKDGAQAEANKELKAFEAVLNRLPKPNEQPNGES